MANSSNNNTIIYIGLGLVATGLITYAIVRSVKKKQGQKEITLPNGETIIVQTETTNKLKSELDDLHSRYKNSTRFNDQLKIPFFRNFYITLYDNGRFFFGRDPKGLYPVKGYWKDNGNLLIFDDGRVYRENTLNDNLLLAKNNIFQNLEYFKDVDEYQEFIREYTKRFGGQPNQMNKNKYEKLIQLLTKYGADKKYITDAYTKAVNEGYVI